MTTEAQRVDRVRRPADRRRATPAATSRLAAAGLSLSLMLALMGRMAAADRAVDAAPPSGPLPSPALEPAATPLAPATPVIRVGVETVTRVVPAAPVARSHGSR